MNVKKIIFIFLSDISVWSSSCLNACSFSFKCVSVLLVNFTIDRKYKNYFPSSRMAGPMCLSLTCRKVTGPEHIEIKDQKKHSSAELSFLGMKDLQLPN
jgi:hypothetical protein